MSTSKIVPGDQLSAYQRWELPVVEDRGSGRAPPTAAQMELVQKQAYEEGFAQGREEGLAAAAGEIRARVDTVDKLLRSLAEPFRDLDGQAEEELLRLAVAIARQLVRRELRADPAAIMVAIREGLAVLPASARDPQVRLHPEDAALVRELLGTSAGDGAWRLAEDPSLNRGDCRIVTETSQVDVGVEARLAAIMAKLLGGARRDDEPTA